MRKYFSSIAFDTPVIRHHPSLKYESESNALILAPNKSFVDWRDNHVYSCLCYNCIVKIFDFMK